jgi:hypothetical protein
MTEVYTSDAVANPTTGDGSILFSYSPPRGILTLRFSFVNDSEKQTTYVIQTNDGSGWEDELKPVAFPNLVEPVSLTIPVAPGHSLRVGIVANAAAAGTSRVVVEYIEKPA